MVFYACILYTEVICVPCVFCRHYQMSSKHTWLNRLRVCTIKIEKRVIQRTHAFISEGAIYLCGKIMVARRKVYCGYMILLPFVDYGRTHETKLHVHIKFSSTHILPSHPYPQHHPHPQPFNSVFEFKPLWNILFKCVVLHFGVSWRHMASPLVYILSHLPESVLAKYQLVLQEQTSMESVQICKLYKYP